jgi:ERCC4-type nuclease
MPIKLIIDTREQKPWKFEGYRVVRRALKFGDYAVSGRERVVAVERKSCADLVGSVTVGFSRVCREFERAQRGGARLHLVVEGSLDWATRLCLERYPNRVFARTLSKFMGATGATPLFCDDRRLAAKMALALLTTGIQ